MTEKRRDDDGVLDPAELDVASDERVRELDSNRFVVSTDDSAPRPDERVATSTPAPSANADRHERTPLADVDSQFAVDVALKNGDRVTERRVTSNSVVDTFEAVVLWYAAQVGDGRTPPEDVVEILYAESSFSE